MEKEKIQTKELLNHWVGKKSLSVKALVGPSGSRSIASKLKRGAERVKASEEEKRRRRHRRI